MAGAGARPAARLPPGRQANDHCRNRAISLRSSQRHPPGRTRSARWRMPRRTGAQTGAHARWAAWLCGLLWASQAELGARLTRTRSATPIRSRVAERTPSVLLSEAERSLEFLHAHGSGLSGKPRNKAARQTNAASLGMRRQPLANVAVYGGTQERAAKLEKKRLRRADEKAFDKGGHHAKEKKGGR